MSQLCTQKTQCTETNAQDCGRNRKPKGTEEEMRNDNKQQSQIAQDEAVQYVAQRHHCTAAYLMDHLEDMHLEDNEVRIINDLKRMYE